MKTRLLAVVLVAAIVGLSACGGSKTPDDPKSSAKEISKIVIGGQEYTKSGDSFTWNYRKTGPDAWESEPTWPASIQITHTGVSVSPSANTITLNTTTGAGVTITVTAEDGSTKTFTVSATKQAEL